MTVQMTFFMALLPFLIGYFFGSIPFGFLLGKFLGFGDIRQKGSGNIGATNALRVAGKKLALPTLLLDMLKGVLAVLFVWGLASKAHGEIPIPLRNIATMMAGVGAVVGHTYPVWLKFKGGKGVATNLAVTLTLWPFTGLLALFLWGGVFAKSRISSLSALCASAAAPFLTWIIYDGKSALFVLFLSVLVFWRHKGNIKNLIKGEEQAFTKKPSSQDQSKTQL